MKLKQYPKYKDSGIQWIGNIPEGWSVNKLKNICNIKRGAPAQDLNFIDEHNKNSIRLIRIEDIEEKNNPKYIFNTERIRNAFLIKKNSILIAGTGATAGKSMIVPNHFVSLAFSYNIPLITITKENQIFISYFLNSSYIKQQQFLMFKGSAQHFLDIDNMKSFKVFLPPTSQQMQIATFLDKKTQNISQTIEKDKKLIKLLKEKRIALINHVVTKGLDKNAKMKDSGIDWIGKIPDGWEVRTLKKCCNIKAQYGAGCEPEDNRRKLDYRYIRITDINELGRSRKDSFAYLSKENSSGYILKENDVLFARSGATVGKTYYYLPEDGKCAYAGYLIRYKTNKILNSKFLFFYTLSKSYLGWIKRTLVQSTIENVSAEKYNEMLIPIPSLSTQLQIVQYLDKQTQNIDQTISKIQKKIILMEEYKKSLIHHVVTGKVDVRGIVI